MAVPLFDNMENARTALDWARPVSAHLLDCWSVFEPYADAGFRSEMNRAVADILANPKVSPARDCAFDLLQQRYWEMLTGCALIWTGLTPVPSVERPGVGPDFQVETGGRRLWLECVAPGRGSGPDQVPHFEITDTLHVRCVPVPEISLRLSGAIETKQRIYRQKYLPSGVVGEDDLYVIAVNSGNLGPWLVDDAPPHIVKYLYGIGSLSVSMNVRTGECSEPFLTPKSTLDRQQSSPIPTGPFLDGSFPHVSGVLYSHCDPWNLATTPAEGCVLIRNHSATHPIPAAICARYSCWKCEPNPNGFRMHLEAPTWPQEPPP